MKKIFLFIAVVSAFSFASCKKDRTCTCTTGSATEVYTITQARKSDAKKECISSSKTNGGVTVTTTCTLK